MTPLQILLYLVPPVDLLVSLDNLFALKAQRGDTVSIRSVEWLHRMQELYADGAIPTDGLPEATWAQVGDVIVDTRKEMAF